MGVSDPLLSPEDFKDLNLDTILHDCSRFGCTSFMDAFFKAARSATDTQQKEALNFLGKVCSLKLQTESGAEPFVPMMVMADRRSTSLVDFDEQDLSLIEQILPTIEVPELKARLADILSIRKKKYPFALIAIDAYVESSENIEVGLHFSYCADLLSRAFNLAFSMGRVNEKIKEVGDHILKMLGQYGGKDPIVFGIDIVEILHSKKYGDPNALRPLLSDWALIARNEGKLLIETHCWELYHKLSIQAHDEAGVSSALIEIGEANLREADQAKTEKNRGFFVASVFIQKAIDAFRSVGGQKDRIEALKRHLLECQVKSRAEMHSIPFSFDVSKLIDHAEKMVSGLPLRDAIIRLASMGEIPHVKELRKRVTEKAEQYPLQHLGLCFSVDDRGRTVAHKPSMLLGTPEEVEVATIAEMYREAQFNRNIHISAFVEYARLKINEEHHIHMQDIYFIVLNNPFIPTDRRTTFARGLLAGLHGDYLIAAHLLIPQVENSIRHVLNQHGVVTSKLDKDGIQDEKSLNELFDCEKEALEQIFGEDIVFDLRGLLVERFGGNLRNRFAHGLLDDEDFMSTPAAYLWWITLYLCCFHHIYRQQSTEAESSKPDGCGDAMGTD